MIVTETRNPRCRVEIVSSGGYGGPRVTSDAIQSSLLDLTTHREMGAAAGRFQMTLLPRKPGGEYGTWTWHDLIHPMDYLEISLWVPPREPRVVMRGFVDAVVDQFSIASGRPAHTIVVSGRDFGKLLLLLKLYALDLQAQAIPQHLALINMMQQGLDALTNARQYRSIVEGRGLVESSELIPRTDTEKTPGTWDSTAGPVPVAVDTAYTPGTAMTVLWNTMVKPQYDEMRALYGGLPEADLVVQTDPAEDTKLRTYTPYVLPQFWQPYTDLWSIFRDFQHAPWRELFWEETSDGPRLFYRPTPWLDFGGHVIQPGIPTPPMREAFEIVPVLEKDRIEYTFGRHDEAVQNFFFTLPAVAASYMQETRQQGTHSEGMFTPGELFQTNPYLVGLRNRDLPESSSDYRRMGLRLVEAPSMYFDLDPNVPRNLQEALVASARFLAYDWNKRLVRAFDHGGLLETGTMSLKGDEQLRIGAYIEEFPSHAMAYITGLTHRFRWGTGQDGHFISILSLTRGRGHLARTQKAAAGIA